MAQKTILITGGTGFIGYWLCELSPARFSCIPLSHPELEICDRGAVKRALERYNPQVLINCAARSRVRFCEDNWARVFAVNSLGPRILAEECRERGILFCHFSTNYVFGDTDESPLTTPPPNNYGLSKLAGEWAVQSYPGLTVRTSLVFGKNRQGEIGGPVRDILADKSPLRVISDQLIAVTYVKDLAKGLFSLLDKDYAQDHVIHHLVNDGCCTWQEFASCAARLLKREIVFEPVSLEQYFQDATKRPLRSCLKPTLPMPHWRDALGKFISSI